MFYNLQFISEAVATTLGNYLANFGSPTEDRVLIYSPKDQETMVGNVIIPGTDNNEKPRKGVVVLAGHISEAYVSYKELVKPGRILTYGLYAGKEVQFDLTKLEKETGIKLDESKGFFSVLSINEIIYSEINK